VTVTVGVAKTKGVMKIVDVAVAVMMKIADVEGVTKVIVGADVVVTKIVDATTTKIVGVMKVIVMSLQTKTKFHISKGLLLRAGATCLPHVTQTAVTTKTIALRKSVKTRFRRGKQHAMWTKSRKPRACQHPHHASNNA
jgi:hypothetical protein